MPDFVSAGTGRIERVPTDARARHDVAVGRLAASYAAIPVDAPVRLAKKTSNLFRARARTDAPGLDVALLDQVIAVDAEARTADVQGMCTYEHLVEATLPHGLAPLVVPQLKTITLGGAVTGLGHRVHVVPQRAAPRVGAGDGHPHRGRRDRHGAPRG